MRELKNEYDVVILAAGDFPTNETAIHILRTAKHLIACDGAVEEVLRMGIEPEVIVGDGDSVSTATKVKYQSIFHTIVEQEDNDLTKATKYALQANILFFGYNRQTRRPHIRKHSITSALL